MPSSMRAPPEASDEHAGEFAACALLDQQRHFFADDAAHGAAAKTEVHDAQSDGHLSMLQKPTTIASEAPTSCGRPRSCSRRAGDRSTAAGRPSADLARSPENRHPPAARCDRARPTQVVATALAEPHALGQVLLIEPLAAARDKSPTAYPGAGSGRAPRRRNQFGVGATVRLLLLFKPDGLDVAFDLGLAAGPCIDFGELFQIVDDLAGIEFAGTTRRSVKTYGTSFALR